MNDITTLLLIAIISVGIGIGFGSVFTNAMNARHKTSAPENDEPVGLKEIARVYQDERANAVVLQINGKKYRKPDELGAGVRAELEKLLADLLVWIRPFGVSQTVEPEGNAVSAAGVPPAKPPLKESRLAGAPEKAAGSLPAEENLKQSYNPLDVFMRALRTDTFKATTPQTSIAAQIDEILQEKLEGLPDEKRAIRLMELPGKGMVVMVGLDHYDGVETVPDPEVRTLIKECVAEWEKRMDRQK